MMFSPMKRSTKEQFWKPWATGYQRRKRKAKERPHQPEKSRYFRVKLVKTG
jgi:hypothetical protein